MRIAYLDCFAGISGDMFLAALVDAGVPQEVLQQSVAALGIGATIAFERVDRSGISACKANVLENGHPAETPHTHSHGHKQDHAHGRSLSAIRKIIAAAALPDVVKASAVLTFELLGEAEAQVHNVPVEKIHFHEVGAVDAIADIVAASAGVAHLASSLPIRWHCSPVNLGSGTVPCAHGNFPVPAPATALLLRDCPTYSAHIEKELTTPTGAALLRMLAPEFGAQPAMRVQAIGYGAGSRNPEKFPNVLRLSLGETADADNAESISVLETAIDDMSPQLLAHAAELLLRAGALDVMLAPVLMKKGRPGTLLTVLCSPAEAQKLEAVIFRETSTLGIRSRREVRHVLERSHRRVATPFGEVRVKIASQGDTIVNLAPEYEDCRAAAEAHSVPLKLVMQAAIAACAGDRKA